MATKDSHHFPTSESQPCPKFRFERFHPIPNGGLEADSLALARGPPEPIHQKMMVLPSLVGLHVAHKAKTPSTASPQAPEHIRAARGTQVPPTAKIFF